MVGGEYSVNAILLYGLLLNRTMLSQKNGWVDDEGNVYVIYTIRQMANDLNRSERTVKAALCELEDAGLLLRVRQGWNKANRLFLLFPDMVQISSPPVGKICPMDGQFSSPCMGQNLPPSNTDIKYKDINIQKGEGTKRAFGLWKNVFLSEAEYASLQADFPNWYGEYINRLSHFIAANGHYYADHYAMLLKWLDEDHRVGVRTGAE